MSAPDESKQDKADSANTAEEDELSALLNSAVKDFGATEELLKEDTKEKNPSDTPSTKPTPPDTLWTDDFIRNSSSRFDQNMAALFSPGSEGPFTMEQLSENIQRLAEASTQAVGFESSPDNEFSSIIAQTLRNLAENADNIQNSFSEDDLMNMLGSLGNMGNVDNNSGDPGELMTFMQKMMQNLLCKECLSPALTGIVEKYPDWLEKNREKLAADELANREKQLDIMKKVCAELDTEDENDSEEIKNNRFQKVLGLMHEMQDCGQPPEELVGELGPIFDEEGRPQLLPGMSPDQCNLQ